MVQEKRRFTDELEYVTSPGWRVRKWPSGEYVTKQELYGKFFYGGPSACITDMAIFRFDETGLMYLDTVHPGYSAAEVKSKVDFDLNISRCSGETKPPTYRQLEILYKEVDPEGIFLPQGAKWVDNNAAHPVDLLKFAWKYKWTHSGIINNSGCFQKCQELLDYLDWNMLGNSQKINAVSKAVKVLFVQYYNGNCNQATKNIGFVVGLHE